MIVSESGRLRWRSPFQSNVSSITTHFGGRMTPSSVGRKRPASARAYGSISRASGLKRWPWLRVERAVGLEVVKLTGLEAGNEHAPDIAPAVGLGIEFDDAARLAVVDVSVEQHPHRGGRFAINDKLHAAVAQHRAVGQRVAELGPAGVGLRLVFGMTTKTRRARKFVAVVNMVRRLGVEGAWETSPARFIQADGPVGYPAALPLRGHVFAPALTLRHPPEVHFNAAPSYRRASPGRILVFRGMGIAMGTIWMLDAGFWMVDVDDLASSIAASSILASWRKRPTKIRASIWPSTRSRCRGCRGCCGGRIRRACCRAEGGFAGLFQLDFADGLFARKYQRAGAGFGHRWRRHEVEGRPAGRPVTTRSASIWWRCA